MVTTRASNSLLVALNSLVGDKTSERNIQKLYKTLAGHLDYLFVTILSGPVAWTLIVWTW